MIGRKYLRFTLPDGNGGTGIKQTALVEVSQMSFLGSFTSSSGGVLVYPRPEKDDRIRMSFLTFDTGAVIGAEAAWLQTYLNSNILELCAEPNTVVRNIGDPITGEILFRNDTTGLINSVKVNQINRAT